MGQKKIQAIPKLLERLGDCQGLGEREASTIPFRIESDLTFVAHNKKIMMLCEYVCHLAREEGLVDVQLEDHQMKPKMRVSAASWLG